jgi:hypothetical protein
LPPAAQRQRRQLCRADAAARRTVIDAVEQESHAARRAPESLTRRRGRAGAKRRRYPHVIAHTDRNDSPRRRGPITRLRSRNVCNFCNMLWVPASAGMTVFSVTVLAISLICEHEAATACSTYFFERDERRCPPPRVPGLDRRTRCQHRAPAREMAERIEVRQVVD